MRINNLIVSLITMLPLSSCGIGGWWIDGNPDAGQNAFKPMYQFWSKTAPDSGVNQKDWVDCGGKENGFVTIPKNDPSIKNRDDAYDKKYDEVESCMISKGYHYIGPCGGNFGLGIRCKKK